MDEYCNYFEIGNWAARTKQDIRIVTMRNIAMDDKEQEDQQCTCGRRRTPLLIVMQNLYRNGMTSRLQPRHPFLHFRVFSHKDATIVKKNSAALTSAMVNAISTTLVGTELEGEHKYRGIVAAANGSLYGMPYIVLRVVKFDLVDKSITHIGPAFDGVMGMGWARGAITDRGFIYCPPDDEGHGIIKIDSNTDTLGYVGIMCCRSQWVHLLHAFACSSYHEDRSK